jgi:hypothetical protein
MISNLLKVTTVQHAAQIIGHNDIQSTMSYQRYPLSKQEIQDLLEDIEFVKQSIGHQKLDTTSAYVNKLFNQNHPDVMLDNYRLPLEFHLHYNQRRYI